MGEKERFETAIASNIDDDAAYLVYADWLQERGDPRGELIMLQHRQHDDAANALLIRHANHFYGALAARPDLIDATWHLGFLRSCRFSLDSDHGPGHEQRALAALEELLLLPSARFIRDLSIGVMNVPYNSYRSAIAVLAGHDLRSLERVALGEGIEHTKSNLADAFTTEIGPTRQLYSVAPNLRSMILRSTEDDPDLDGIALPRLSELRVSGAGSGQWLSTFLRTPLPELVTLELTGRFAVEDEVWTPLLSGVNFPKLRHLALGIRASLEGRAGALIANARILRQLHTLDLSKTGLGETDVDALIASGSAFAHLQKLDLGLVWDMPGPDEHAALMRLCAKVDYYSLSPG
ncbi:MAG: TIGR02996 domain-containing protein [Myxococcota bacterium]|nr:TIGR02996 domain-containing protein [Myxococcota bacterium]